MFVPSLRRSQLSWPGKRMEHVMPERPAETRWFKSPYVGVVSFRVLKPMLRLNVITCQFRQMNTHVQSKTLSRPFADKT